MTALPDHLTANRERAFLLRRWANSVAGLYGEAVWLCGSALRADNPDPRDWDVRLRMPHDAFEARYGNPEAWEAEGATGDWTGVRWRWPAENVKQTRRAWRHVRLNVDFQVYPAAYWDRVYGTLPRARLDTAPPSAAASSGQFVVGLRVGMAHLSRAAPDAPVEAGLGIMYIGDERAAPNRVGPQVVCALNELGWSWCGTVQRWVAETH